MALATKVPSITASLVRSRRHVAAVLRVVCFRGESRNVRSSAFLGIAVALFCFGFGFAFPENDAWLQTIPWLTWPFVSAEMLGQYTLWGPEVFFLRRLMALGYAFCFGFERWSSLCGRAMY